MNARAIVRAGRVAALALAATAGLGIGAAAAAGGKKCGLVCVYEKPGFKGRRVCYRNPISTPNLQRAWGAGFVPGSVTVKRHGRCSPIAYFFTETGYRGVVAAYFGTAADITERRFRSFRLKHFEFDD
jgi:hypothetical protein